MTSLKYYLLPVFDLYRVAERKFWIKLLPKYVIPNKKPKDFSLRIKNQLL